MIIYGTGYYGKRNIVHVRDTCESCGYTGHLKSYDATHFFTLYFIPIIPLGSQHVMQLCPKCEAGRMISLGKWNKLKRESIQPAIEAHAARPSDPDAAEEALSAVIGSDDHFGFYEVALSIEEHLAKNPHLLARLAWAYNYFMMDAEATAAYQVSLNLKDDPDVRQAFAIHLMHMGQIDQAADHFKMLPVETDAEQAGAALMLGSGFQSEGRHEEALLVLNRIDRNLIEDEDLIQELDRLSAISNENLGTETRVQSPHLMSEHVAPAARTPTSALRRWAPFMAIPAIIMVIVGIWFFANLGGGGKVFLVNGLDKPYDVLINGQQYRLPAKGHKPISVSGMVSIKPAPGGLAIEPVDIEIDEPFWSRAGSDYVFVINPDRTAVLLWEEGVYQTVTVSSTYNYSLHAGRPLHVFDDIDYAMMPMPKQIKTSSSSSRDVRYGVSLAKQFSPIEAAEVLKNYLAPDGDLAPEDYLSYLKSVLTHRPKHQILTYYLLFYAPDEQTLKFLEKRLTDRPVLVTWHRTYQTLTEQVHPAQDLYGRYVKLAQSEPNDRDLAYLAGRLASDPDDAMKWFSKGIATPNPSAYAHYAMGYHRSAMGEFEPALTQLRNALKLLPDSMEFKLREDDVLEAAGRLDELIANKRKVLKKDKASVRDALTAVRLLAQQGKIAEADRMINQTVAALNKIRADSNGEYSLMLRASKAAGAADNDAYVKVAAKLRAPLWVFRHAVATGQLDRAAKHVADADPRSLIENHLLLYILATRAGKKSLAKQQFDATMKILKVGSKDERLLGKYLTAAKPPELRIVVSSGGDSQEKRITLAAIGLRHPSAREAYFELARKHNFRRVFPYMQLEEVLKP